MTLLLPLQQTFKEPVQSWLIQDRHLGGDLVLQPGHTPALDLFYIYNFNSILLLFYITLYKYIKIEYVVIGILYVPETRLHMQIYMGLNKDK